MTAIEEYYKHKTVCGYGELSAKEQVEMALEATAEGCANLMRVARETDCPPEAVALVVLMRQLTAGLQENNLMLINALGQLFSQRHVKLGNHVPYFEGMLEIPATREEWDQEIRRAEEILREMKAGALR